MHIMYNLAIPRQIQIFDPVLTHPGALTVGKAFSSGGSAAYVRKPSWPWTKKTGGLRAPEKQGQIGTKMWVFPLKIWMSGSNI